MKVVVNKDIVKIDKDEMFHAGEYNIHDCTFEFSEEYSENLVKKALFGIGGKYYETVILDNHCEIPYEALKETGTVVLGVYAYEIIEEKLQLRYSPKYDVFSVNQGSYQENIENQEEITPTQFEQYMQALQDGLNQVQESIKELNQATNSANDLVDEINRKLEDGEFIGPQGPQGEQGDKGDTGIGITTVTAGTPVIDEDKTVTPITFNKTDGTNQTVNVEAQNGKTPDLSEYVTNDDLDNLVPKNTASGEIVSVDDAIAYKTFNVTVDGASEQVTTTGANLFENKYETQTKNGITLTKNEDGTITLNGTCSSSETYNDFNLIDLFSYSGENIASVEVISGSATGLIEWQLTDNNWGNVLFMGIQNNINPNSQQFVDGITYTRSTLRVKNNCVCNNLKFGLQIQNGTEVKPYEPYTGGQPSPNPDYPQEITTLTFDKITRCGKNMTDISYTSYSQNCTVENGVATTIPLNNYGWANIGMTPIIIPAGTYYLSCDIRLKSGTANEMNYLRLTGCDFTSVTNPQITSNFQRYVFSNTILEQTRYTTFGIQTDISTDAVLEIKNIMISKTNGNYEPYQATEYAIDLQGNEMSGTSKVVNKFIIDKEGNLTFIKNTDEIIFDSSNSNWYSGTTNTDGKPRFFNSSLRDIIKHAINNDEIGVIYSDYFTNVSANNTYKCVNGLSVDIDGALQIYDDKFIDYTQEQFNDFMEEHSVKIIYALAKPQTIPLGTLSELITTLNGTNNISINGNIPTTISTTYALDIKKYIDNKLAEISTAMIEEG